MKLKNAVVIGGSITGMLAARMLAKHFESVTIVETDKLPLQPQMRKGVPQSMQSHILLAQGYRILEDLFPGISSDLSAAGALPIDWLREFHYFSQGKWSHNDVAPSDIVSFTCSRPLLEWAIRQRLKDFSQIQFVEQHRAIGLLTNPSKTQITGVSIRATCGNGCDELPSTLLVDASGRRSHAPQWLENLGFEPPSETVVNPYVGYATRYYKKRQGYIDDWKVMLIAQEPPNIKRFGYLAKTEDEKWIVTLGGYGHDFPPLDNQGFSEFARSLSSSRFYETIKDAEPVSPIYAHRATANRLRHYEKIHLPQGFVTLGDAVCALCPVYGLGMTVSALSAIVLQDWLSEGTFISSRFQKSLAKSNFFHWKLVTGIDSRFSTTHGGTSKPSLIEKIADWYNLQVAASANSDANLHILYTEIAQLLKSPLALYHPHVILQVITQTLMRNHLKVNISKIA